MGVKQWDEDDFGQQQCRKIFLNFFSTRRWPYLIHNLCQTVSKFQTDNQILFQAFTKEKKVNF